MSDYATDIECPCCGDVGAVADAEGYFYDGQKLVCGCKGSIVCDTETDPYIDADGCDVDHDRPPEATP